MQCRRDGERWLVRLEKGEKVRERLAAFARERGLEGGTISAIGAFEEARIAYFDEAAGAYRGRTVEGGLEVLSLVGNLSVTEEGEPMVHLHALLGRDDYTVLGGHLDEAEVSVTLEAVVEPAGRVLRRVPFGPLKLWDLEA